MDFDPTFMNEIASSINVSVEGLMAVVEVESAGSGFQNGLVKIRWEGHYFWRYLPKNLRPAAQSQGLAHPKYGVIPNSRNMAKRHARLETAMKIDRQAALKSISMGVGQVMGANFEICGYMSVEDMWEDCKTLEGQIRAMANFIKSENLDVHIRNCNWAAFARKYNGPSYKDNNYDVKMRQAFIRFGGSDSKHQNGDICVGHPNAEKVRHIQKRLAELNYRISPDGDFGPNTERAVKMFQVDYGLDVTGCVDSATREKLETVSPKNHLVTGRIIDKKELKKRSRIISGGGAVDKVGIATVAVTGTAQLVETTEIVENVEQVGKVVNSVNSAIRPIQSVIDFMTSNLWIVPLIAGIFLIIIGRRIISARLEDHETGKTL